MNMQNMQIVAVNRAESENMHILKLKMVDGRHIGNRIFAITLNHSTDRDEILHEHAKHADCGCKPCEKLKFAYFENSRWRTSAI